MVAVVLPDNGLAANLPQPRIMVGAGSDQVGRVRAEGAIPHPSLMAGQGGLERVRLGLLLGLRLDLGHLPDLGGVIGAAGS